VNTMHAYLLATAMGAALGLVPCHAAAAVLHPYSQISSDTVHLSDLFGDLANTADRALGAAPAPGARIVVSSPQLAAIARDYDVDWRPQSGGEQVIVERRADLVSQARIVNALRAALTQAGAPADFDLATPDLQPVMIPAGAVAEPDVSQLSYDPAVNRFTALVSVSVPGAPSVQMRVSGQVVAMVQASVATRRLSPGTVLQQGDLRPARVRAALLRASGAVVDAVGMAMRHDLAAGQVLTSADLTRPSLVERGGLVRMSLVSDGLALSAQGIANESGARGDRIRVENPMSHLVVIAEVTGAGEVRVAPREAVVTLVSAQ